MRSRWRSPAGVLALAGILLGSGVLGFLVYRVAPQPKTVSKIVSAAPPVTDAAPPPASHPIPETLPDISLPDVNGDPHRLADWAGSPLIVNFWATWCEPCRREIPLLEGLYRENPRTAFEIVGIAIDHLDSVVKYARQMKIDYPILVGEKGGLEAAAAFGREPVLPFTVFADAQGRDHTYTGPQLHKNDEGAVVIRLEGSDAGTTAATPPADKK